MELGLEKWKSRKEQAKIKQKTWVNVWTCQSSSVTLCLAVVGRRLNHIKKSWGLWTATGSADSWVCSAQGRSTPFHVSGHVSGAAAAGACSPKQFVSDAALLHQGMGTRKPGGFGKQSPLGLIPVDVPPSNSTKEPKETLLTYCSSHYDLQSTLNVFQTLGRK